jgi:hypothetical protein
MMGQTLLRSLCGVVLPASITLIWAAASSAQTFDAQGETFQAR